MTIFGWDMSHYDNPSIGSAIDEGIQFITHKAGGDQRDPDLGVWWKNVKDHRDRLLVGAYWVLYPGNPVGRAADFIARLDAWCPGWRDGPFILQADCEQWNGDPATVPSKSDISQFCDSLVARAPMLEPIVYAPRWVYRDSLAGLRYPLWASSYVSGQHGFKSLYPGDDSSLWAPYSGQTPAILQYSSSATIGGQSTSDANAFRGTLDELITLVAPGWSGNVNVDDLVKNSSEDKIPETPLGHFALSQGIPDGTRGGQRVAAWQAIQNLGTAVMKLQAADSARSAALDKLQASVDALAARPIVTVPESDLAAAVLDALKQLAAPKTP